MLLLFDDVNITSILLACKYFTMFIFIYYICTMKEGIKVLSIQTDQTIINKLKDICRAEKRSQAKTIEVLIEEKHKLLKVK